jgi:hypothetical protein
MKKYIISTFCSAIIVPGMGQVINGQIKKGLIHMGIVFVIIFTLVMKLAKMIMNILPGIDPEKVSIDQILAKVDFTDYTFIRVISFIFLVLWIYSIIDAFIIGLRKEREKNSTI